MKKLLICLALLFATIQPGEAYVQRDQYGTSWYIPNHAQARHRHHGNSHAAWHHILHRPIVVRDDGRPYAWCGWWMRHHVARDPGVEYNRAAQWLHWGRALSSPIVGAIGVLPHHVFMVTQVISDHIIRAISGNDSHTVRDRIRSTAGVIGWRGL